MAYDLGVAVVLLFATWRGAVKGFVWQLATIAALVLAFCFAGPLSGRIAPLTGLKSPLDRWVSLLGLYVVFSFGCFLLARSLKSGIEKIKFEDYDRHLGAIFGFLKGAVVCLVVTFFGVTLWAESHPYILGSYTGYASAVIFDELRPIVPNEYHAHLDDSLKKLGQCGLDPDNPFCETDVADSGDGDHDHPGHEHDDDPDAPSADHHHLLFGLLAGLPKEQAEYLHLEIDRAIDEASPTQRQAMIHQLEEASPETIVALLDQWQSIPDDLPPGLPTIPTPTPIPGGQGTGPLTEAEKTERRDLLFDIARTYTQFPAAQQSIVDEVAAQLRGVPDRVQLAVLRDWHADLLPGSNDPDPTTSALTPLDERIGRQLTLADILIDSLGQALRDRLGSWR